MRILARFRILSAAFPFVSIFDVVANAAVIPVVMLGIFEVPLFPQKFLGAADRETASTSLRDSYYLALLVKHLDARNLIEVGKPDPHIPFKTAERAERAEGIVVGAEGNAGFGEELPAWCMDQHPRDDIKLYITGEIRLQIALRDDFVPDAAIDDLT